MEDQGHPAGPYLAIAALCDQVLREVSGTNSLIRVIDRVTVHEPAVPAMGPSGPVNLLGLFSGYLVLSFRAGDFEGPATISLLGIAPDGDELPREDIPVLFEGETKGPNTGPNLILDLKIGITSAGYFWFTVLLNDVFVTRVPLRVVVEPSDVEETPAAASYDDSPG